MSKFNEEDFKKSLEGKSVEELRKLEEKIVKECDAIDKEVAETEFDMPTENYAEVAKAVKFFLNKQIIFFTTSKVPLFYMIYFLMDTNIFLKLMTKHHFLIYSI